MTSLQLYERNLRLGSDIGAHMPRLLAIGKYCDHITEFGVRGGNSTSCWLAAQPSTIRCYDITVPLELGFFWTISKAEHIDFEFKQADTSRLESIAETDLLFLDTLHTSAQLAAELKHADSVRKYIVMHDTETNGWVGEGNTDGLLKALIEFLLTHSDWRINEHFPECNGLTVLERA